MSFRMGVTPLLAFSALLAAVQIAPAQVKVATISMQQAVFDTAEIKKADAEMQSKYKDRDADVEKIRAQGAAANQKLQDPKSNLTPQQEADLQALITKLDRELQRKNEDLQADVEKDRNDILGKATQKMIDVVKKLSEERGLDLVVEASTISTVAYFKPALDITKDATAAFDKAYPAAAPAAKPAAPAKPAGK